MAESDGLAGVETVLKERGIDLATLIKDTHAGTTLILSSLLEGMFAITLEAAMGHLSKNSLKKLLTGYGPLSSFSAKIDIAYGMKLITKEMHSNANLIRSMRNKFAHGTTKLDFESGDIVKIGSALSTFDQTQPDVLAALMKAIDGISLHLRSETKRYVVAAAP
ncbi:MltR family transcriptional regulator [Bradyrhizobium sp.]|uniref:MltR family transcriptional regulator n=1 Tax=Bradyrhizobium sp. TaxID=376 RepID=UPI003C72874D